MELSGVEEMVMPTHDAWGKASRAWGLHGKEPAVTQQGFLPEKVPSIDYRGKNCISLSEDDAELSSALNVPFRELDPQDSSKSKREISRQCQTRALWS